MPRFVTWPIIIMVALATVPLVLVARARVSKSKSPRLHVVFDMDQQDKYKTQQVNPAFADSRAMRPRVAGTVARGEDELKEDDHYYRGKVGDKWATDYPVPLTRELLTRGRERYDVFCATCHGLTGDGRGPTAIRAEEPRVMEQGTWVPPTPYTQESVLKREVGHLYNTIANGIRNMPAYSSQIPVRDRWAIVAYVRALMRSQNARIEDVPPEMREKLR